MQRAARSSSSSSPAPTCSSRTSGPVPSIATSGQTGPRPRTAGYDAVAQAEGGLMSATGAPDGPPYRLGLPIADMVAGLYAAQGITAALFARTRPGRGGG